MLKNKLEIFVITYNRAEKLKSTLEKLADNRSPVRNFDVKILDNASTDNTENICHEFVQKHPNFTYVRNKINVGIKTFSIKPYIYSLLVPVNGTFKWNTIPSIDIFPQVFNNHLAKKENNIARKENIILNLLIIFINLIPFFYRNFKIWIYYILNKRNNNWKKQTYY